jgi:hypothetical protein
MERFPAAKEIVDFVSELRFQGYEVDTKQCIAAHNLLVEVAASGSFQHDSQNICGWLAPIFCTTPEEQTRFEPLFEKWWHHDSSTIAAEAGSPPKHIKEHSQSHDAELILPHDSLLKRIPPLLLLASGLTLVGSAILVYFWILRLGSSNQAQGTIGYIAVSTGRLMTITVSLVLIGILIATGLLWWFWIKRQRRLLKWRTRNRHRVHPLMVKGATEQIKQLLDLRRIAQDLRRHRPLKLYDLDPETTVVQSIRRGLFSPAYGSRKALPEYLVLIDRYSFSDQLAQLDSQIVDLLIKYDVIIDRFYFQGDPRICREDKAVPLQFSLRDLAASHPHHHLLIFSDAEDFFDPLQGAPQQWLELFSPWLNRTLFTPTYYQSYKNEVLSELGFLVLPSNREGIAALVEAINWGGHSAVRKLRAESFPAVLAERPSRWLESHEPPPNLVGKLCVQLKNYLGNDGYFWLSACAVYPMLYWDLTLYLGSRLINEQAVSKKLSNLVRLPWFRHGSMPDWLRKRLISELPHRSENAVRKAIEDLLFSSLSNPDGFVLPIADSATTPAAEGYLQRLRTVLKAWQQRILLRSLLFSESSDSALREQVFLSFMIGLRPDHLSVPLPPQVVLPKRRPLRQAPSRKPKLKPPRENVKSALERLFKPRTRGSSLKTIHVTTYVFQGTKYAFTSTFAIFAGYLMQNRLIRTNDLLMLAIPVIASLFFFVCYANRFHSEPLHANQGDERRTLLQSEAIRVFPLIAIPIVVSILLVITRTEALSLLLLTSTMIYAALYYLYGLYLIRYRTPSDGLPLVRHQLVWPVVLSIAIGLYFGRFLPDLKISLVPLLPLMVILAFYLVSEILQFSGRQFLRTSLLLFFLVGGLIVVTQIMRVTNSLTRSLPPMLFCVAVSAYLAVFEAWKITADIAAKEHDSVNRLSSESWSGKASQYASATLAALVITIWVVPFAFIFSDYGSLFLIGFIIHSFAAFIFWFYFGRQTYFQILPWASIKTVAGLTFLGLLVAAPFFNQTIVPAPLRNVAGPTGLALLMPFAAFQALRLMVDVRRIVRRTRKRVFIRLLDHRMNFIRILSALCLIASFIVVFLLQSVDESSVLFRKAGLAFGVYATSISFCLIIEVTDFLKARPKTTSI